MMVCGIALTLVLIYGLRSLYVCASMVFSWRGLTSTARSTDASTTGAVQRLDVLIPALREQAVLPGTLRHYADLAANWPQLRVWVVTADREDIATPPGKSSTQAVAREVAGALNLELGTDTFQVVSYPGEGRRASQLNYALTLLTPGGYVAVFDADARPSSTLRIDFALAASALPAMIQQLQLPAYSAVAIRSRSSIMSGQDLYAFRRVLGIEYRRIILAGWCRTSKAWAVIRAMLRPMVYGIGSGLIVSRDHLDQIGQFQEPHDDLAIGHRLSLAGESIVVLPSVNVVEPYHDLPSMAKAFSSVAFGNAATLADYRFARHRPSRLNSAEQLLLLWRALADGILWAIGPVVTAMALAISASSNTVGLASVGVALLLNGIVEPIMAHTLRIGVLRRYQHVGVRWFHQASLLRGMATYLAQPAITAAGPWLLGWRWFAATLRGHPISFGKTTHIGSPEERTHG